MIDHCGARRLLTPEIGGRERREAPVEPERGRVVMVLGSDRDAREAELQSP